MTINNYFATIFAGTERAHYSQQFPFDDTSLEATQLALVKARELATEPHGRVAVWRLSDHEATWLVPVIGQDVGQLRAPVPS